MINHYAPIRMLRDLNYGETIRGGTDVIFNEFAILASHSRYQPFSYQQAIENFVKLAERRNYYEKLRVGMIQEPMPDFIRHAKPAEAI